MARPLVLAGGKLLRIAWPRLYQVEPEARGWHPDPVWHASLNPVSRECRKRLVKAGKASGPRSGKLLRIAWPDYIKWSPKARRSRMALALRLGMASGSSMAC